MTGKFTQINVKTLNYRGRKLRELTTSKINVENKTNQTKTLTPRHIIFKVQKIREKKSLERSRGGAGWRWGRTTFLV